MSVHAKLSPAAWARSRAHLLVFRQRRLRIYSRTKLLTYFATVGSYSDSVNTVESAHLKLRPVLCSARSESYACCNSLQISNSTGKDASVNCVPAEAPRFPSPSGHLSFLNRFVEVLSSSLELLNCTGWKSFELSQGRPRDVFPLPLLLQPFDDMEESQDLRNLLMALTNNVIRGLNCLYGCRPSERKAILCQKVVQRRLWSKCSRFVERLSVLSEFTSGAEALNSLTDSDSKAIGKLKADSVDMLNNSARVEPMKYVPQKVREELLGDSMFNCKSAFLKSFPDVKPQDRIEYVRLVVRQLRSGKVELAKKIVAGGTVFGVAKRGSSKVREVWHGSKVSRAACQPPAPPHLASPSALLDLEASASQPILLTKRDGRCLFDQLRLPSGLRKYMGRPAISLKELMELGGMTTSEVRSFAPDIFDDSRKLHPVSCCWPMGFSWSSYIAQSTMLGLCRSAGLRQCRVLAADSSTPADMSHVFALATDDIMEFTRRGHDYATKSADRLDRAFARVGIEKNVGKDVTAQRNGVCIGIDLVNGTHLAPFVEKLGVLLPALVELLERPRVTPYGLASVLGVAQWFNQLNRPLFSILDSVYTFCRLPRPRTAQSLSNHNLAELWLVTSMAPLWEADLTRKWLNEIEATDASTDFGYGICSRTCSISLSRRLGRLSEKRGDFIRLRETDSESQVTRNRLGNPQRLGLSKASFKTVLSCRAKFKAHAGALEAGSLVLLLRWLVRSSRKHGHRIVALVDAKAVLAAAAKGRSSARTLKKQLQKLAALTLSGDFLMRYLYIPSEDNPADAPSRGVQGEYCRKQKKPNCHLEYLDDVQHAEERIRRFESFYGAPLESFLP